MRTLITMAVTCAFFLAGSAAARDLEDILDDIADGVQISTRQAQGIQGIKLPFDLAGFTSEFNASILSDRFVPLSSSVSGFTYDFNETLDIFERSTSTFGPLFSERASTLGRRRLFVSLSHTFIDFDEFEGADLGGLATSEVAGPADVQARLIADGIAGAGFPNLADDIVDLRFDLDVEQSISTLYLNYGLTDRIDFGLAMPLVRVKIKAVADLERTDPNGDSQGPIDDCTAPRNLDPSQGPIVNTQYICRVGGAGALRDSDDYLGIGDLVARAKWHFLSGALDAAAFLNMTIPTGSTENLTGFHTMTFTPGIVLSRDFETPFGGMGVHANLAYEIRPDLGSNSEFEWVTGFSFQPTGRTSMVVDLIGSHEMGNDGIGENILDVSIGGKFMIADRLILTGNAILPLNDQGLRSDTIWTGQIEYVFGVD